MATLQPMTPTPSSPPPTPTPTPLLNPVVSAGALDYLSAQRINQQRSSIVSSASRLRSASLLRNDLETSTQKGPRFDHFSAGGSHRIMDYGEVLGNAQQPKNNYNQNNNNKNNNNMLIPNLGQLPVGATIPLAKLDASGSRLNPTPFVQNFSPRTTIVAEEQRALPLGRGLAWRPVSPEFLNYCIALLIFAIRYPSVFWGTNKFFSVIFSVQMIFTGIQTILLTSAFSILYKLHLMGGRSQLHGSDDLLLSLPITILLFALSVFLLTLSCVSIYLHGYHKFVAFLTRSRRKYQITYKEEPVPVGQYAGHITGLVFLILLCLCSGPLVWDLSRIYRGSLDNVILTAVISTIVHIFAWIALWLIFTVKSNWTFKLRVTVARACVASARSIKLVNDVELAQAQEENTAPLLVIGGGRAFPVPESTHKKSIMGVVQKAQASMNAGNSAVYWHRPTTSTLSPRPERAHSSRENDSGKGKSPAKKSTKTNRAVSPMSGSEDDNGDYALLLEEGGIKGGEGGRSSQSPHKNGKKGVKLTRAASTSAADARYVDRRQIMAYRRQSEQLQKQIQHQQEVDEDNDVMPPLPPPPPGLGGPSNDVPDGSTPRSSRSPDSGLVVQEDPSIHRSDSASTTTSSTATNHQPDQSTSSTNTTTNHSEQSEHRNKCGSDDDLSQLPSDPSNFPSYPRPLRSQNIPQSLYNDSTVVIRRQRNLTRELHPPADPIYSSRSITSFKEEPVYGSSRKTQEEDDIYGNRKGSPAADDLLAQAQNAANSQNFGSTSSGSVGYHTASNSSGSNSPVPPVSTTPGLATPPPPMAPLYPHHKQVLGHPIYGQRMTANTHHAIYGQTQGVPHHKIYGRTGQSKLPQAPQIPLPPIPQGSIPENDFPPPLSSPSPLSPPPGDLYPGGMVQRSFSGNGAADFANSRYGLGGGGTRVVAVGRSSSLRFAPGTPPRHFTNSLPHVLPRSSHYNTGV